MPATPSPPSIGVSSCLLGELVRYDGDHRRDDIVCNTLSQHFNLVSFCPEMAIGLGVPRPTIQLIKRGNTTSLVDTATQQIDHTQSMIEATQRFCADLPNPIAGYVVKSRSPSCGNQGVNLFYEDGRVEAIGTGMFIAELIKQFPGMPVVNDEQLHHPAVLSDFMQRVHSYATSLS